MVTSRRPPKPDSEIQSEIRAILKQIISMVTYLPVIQEPTVFNILAYTSDSAEIPAGEWVDTDPLAIEASKSQQVKMSLEVTRKVKDHLQQQGRNKPHHPHRLPNTFR